MILIGILFVVFFFLMGMYSCYDMLMGRNLNEYFRTNLMAAFTVIIIIIVISCFFV